MRSRATGFGILTAALLLAVLPPTFPVPLTARPGPFVDVARAHSPTLAAVSARRALFSGLSAFVTPTFVSSPSSIAAKAHLRPVQLAAAGKVRSTALEARRVLRWQTTAVGTTAAKTAAARPPRQTLSKPNNSARATAVAGSRYRVVIGDTLWTIARRVGVSVDAIVIANGLSSPHRLRIGQVLLLPSGAKTGAAAPARAGRAVAAARPRPVSMTYRVQSGDTLSAIAIRYGTSVGAIVAANGLPSAHRLKIGQRLTVPAASGGGTAPAADRISTLAAPAPFGSMKGFIWPTRGLLTSRYGWRHRRHHDGIDLAAPRGSPIYAARDGRVVFAGWYYGYGRSVILSHSDGMTTLYGHASSLFVRTGETVRRGDIIARVGCTGHCTGSHLHFEVRINGRAVNPLRYLN